MTKQITENYIKKWNNKIKDLANTEHLRKEIMKVRNKSLRQVLLLRYLIYLSMDNTKEYFELLNIDYSIDKIQSVLNCGKRTAYDYMRFIRLFLEMNELMETSFYKMLAYSLELKEKEETLGKKLPKVEKGGAAPDAQ